MRHIAPMLLTLVTLIGGLALLIAGGDLLVRGAVRLAEKAGVSPLIVGIAIVGFGTSMPELVASVEAALIGAPGIAWGNIVGSNLANTLLILGAAAIIAPFAVGERALWRDTATALGATALLFALGLADMVGFGAGLLLVALLVSYLVFAYYQESGDAAHHGAAFDRGSAREAVEHFEGTGLRGWLVAGLLVMVGLALLIGGGRLLVTGAVDLARLLAMPETVIGLTIVAFGTSCPELVTSAIAAFRRQGELAFGNVIGSNIYNLLGIGGVTALVAPGTLPPEFVRSEFPVLLASAVLLIAVAALGWRFTRLLGLLLLAAYGAYLTLLVMGANG